MRLLTDGRLALHQSLVAYGFEKSFVVVGASVCDISKSGRLVLRECEEEQEGKGLDVVVLWSKDMGRAGQYICFRSPWQLPR